MSYALDMAVVREETIIVPSEVMSVSEWVEGNNHTFSNRKITFTLYGLTKTGEYSISVTPEFTMLLNDSENAEESSLLSVEWSQIQWKPYDFDELQNVLIRYMSVDYNIEQLYGHPNTWDITSIESLAGLFNVEPLKDFNADISNWDTSEVTDMSSMFENCTSFNQDISMWNIKKVTNMSKMFKNATVFNFKREDTDYSVGFKNWLMQNREGKFIDDPNGVYIAVEREFDENDFADLDSITFEIGYYLSLIHI